MAARPPAGSEDEREPAVFGIAAVDEHVPGDLSFPATPEDVLAATGDPEVPCGPNAHEVALSTVLDRTGRQRFDSRNDLMDELHDAFERERRDGTGFVAWLTSLFSG